MKYLFYISFALAFSFSSCISKKNTVIKEEISTSQTRRSENILFYEGGTLTEVIERAERQNKLVFVDVVAVWCAPCKLMADEVYTYKPLYEKINKNFISYQVDIEKGIGPNLSFLYNTKTVPTILFLDTKGRVLEKNEGALGIQQMLDLADSAMSSIQ